MKQILYANASDFAKVPLITAISPVSTIVIGGSSLWVLNRGLPWLGQLVLQAAQLLAPLCPSMPA